MSHPCDVEPLNELPEHVIPWVLKYVDLCHPRRVYVCNGSDEEEVTMLKTAEGMGKIKRLTKYENCWLAKTDPADVARVEKKTYMSTPDKRTTVPTPRPGVDGKLGKWVAPDDLEKMIADRFPGCMKGRTMFIMVFSMGPLGGPISKIGVQLTDSSYVVTSMHIMTRMGTPVLNLLKETKEDFIKCVHSVGCPLVTGNEVFVNNWPCNPEKLMISHIPDRNEIISYGSGYGGNSLLGKKCFALRLGSILAHREGWLAEHMLILGITNPQGVKKYITAAFPSACGKTNLAMLESALPGYKIECVGDDIAWMKFDDEGRLRAINPEAGFFGVAPGTSMKTNPNAMRTITKNTIFTNVAETSDGGFYWEGLEDEVDLSNVTVTSWLNKPWTPDSKEPSSHPNSRFCTPASQCPIIDPVWEQPEGVPIDAIIFGGRRPNGVPLVYESMSWTHGVFLGASVSSETTAAAEYTGKTIMHDPFAMRPFFGYNFGHYVAHWLSFQNRKTKFGAPLKLPKIFNVNWFRKNSQGKYMWPGFGDNVRVLDWICRRVDGEDCAMPSPIGNLPKPGSLHVEGLDISNDDMKELFDIPKSYWLEEVADIRKYFFDQVNEDMPKEIYQELDELEKRLKVAA